MTDIIYPSFPAPHSSVHQQGGADDLYTYLGHTLNTAIETIPRHLCNNSMAISSAVLYFTYFTAPIALPVNNIMIANASPAGVTPAHLALGLYTSNAAGDIVALVASTTDAGAGTTALTGINTEYPLPVTTGAGYTTIRGQRYAIGALVSFTTMPHPSGNFNAATLNARSPRVCAQFSSGVTALPSAGNPVIANASLTASSWYFYLAVTS